VCASSASIWLPRIAVPMLAPTLAPHSKSSTCLLSGAVRDARVAGTKRATPLIDVMHSRELPSANFGKPQILWVALMDWAPSSHD